MSSKKRTKYYLPTLLEQVVDPPRRRILIFTLVALLLSGAGLGWLTVREIAGVARLCQTSLTAAGGGSSEPGATDGGGIQRLKIRLKETVQSAYRRQLLIHGGFVVCLIVVLMAFFVAIERIWLKTLSSMVRGRTKDLQRYTKRLETSQNRYRALVESADDLIYTVSAEGRILVVNRYYSEITGQSAEAVANHRLIDIIVYESPDDILAIIKSVMATRRTIEQEEQVRIGGRECWLDTKYKPVIATEEGQPSVLVISRDITQHKNLENQFCETEKLASMGSLSAGIAHEINNPLAIILGFTEMLLERVPDDSKEYEILKTIERQGNNCKRIVEGLLAYARIPTETVTEWDVADSLNKIVSVVRHTLMTKKIDIQTNIAAHLPPAVGDGPQLEQVFMNFINNAMAAMDDGGLLTISGYGRGPYVVIDFTDTGHGIAPATMAQIFEPFFTTKKPGEGTGMGLPVSEGIVKKFGGEIRVKSRRRTATEVGGSTFSVLLPLAVKDTEDRLAPVSLGETSAN